MPLELPGTPSAAEIVLCTLLFTLLLFVYDLVGGGFKIDCHFVFIFSLGIIWNLVRSSSGSASSVAEALYAQGAPPPPPRAPRKSLLFFERNRPNDSGEEDIKRKISVCIVKCLLYLFTPLERGA